MGLRQEDVKQKWNVLLNSSVLGSLQRDENSMFIYFPIPFNTEKNGKNELGIRQVDTIVDDIRTGEIILLNQP
ncbi:MAG: hypothetical protein ABIN89_12210 [Chitinophagaceae bacterium]